jgi:hypothetical protein
MRAGRFVVGSVLVFLSAFALAGCANENAAAPSSLTGCTPACPIGQTCAAGHCEASGGNSSCNPACPLGQSCVNGACTTGGTNNMCVPACPLGQTCSNGTCIGGNGCDPPCLGGVCRDGVCVADSAPASGKPIGAACALGSDCRDGICFNPKSFPGGYCSRSCGGSTITEGASCPSASRCVQLGEAAAYCMGICQSSTDCRAGYACAPSADGKEKTCVAKCKSNDDCPIEKPCNLTSGFCEARAAGMPGSLGASCTTPAECSTETCASEAATNGVFPGGYCLSFCTAADENKPCANGAGLCMKGDNNSFGCLLACNTGVDCRRDYMCSADAGFTLLGKAGVCIPRCNFYECTNGEVCDTSVGICVAPGPGGNSPDAGTPSTNAGITHVDLGSGPIGQLAADLQTVTVDVPPGAISFSLIAKAADPSAQMLPVGIMTPSGKVIYNVNDPTVNDVKLGASGWVTGSMALLFPNAPRVSLVPGKYQIALGSFTNTTSKVDVLFKSQSGVLQGGTLPLVMWFTKNQFLNATTAKTNAAFQKAIADMTRIYGKIGIKIGPLTYIDVPDPVGTNTAVLQDLADAAPLMAYANTSQEQGLHMFFIEQFNFQGGATLLGISGGIPGPPAYPGLQHSGVIVSLAYLGQNSQFGATMAHEGGHILGLFHLNERDGSSFDPLLDTPECTLSDDTNGDKRLDWRECLNKGTENLMFWSDAEVPQEILTNDQRFVLLRNPSVR